MAYPSRFAYSKPAARTKSFCEQSNHGRLQTAVPRFIGDGSSNSTTGIRYMSMGDSITEATCWRSKLWHKLQSTEFAKTNFVGSKNGDSG